MNIEVALFHHDIERAAEEYRSAFELLNRASELTRELQPEQIEHLDDLELLKKIM